MIVDLSHTLYSGMPVYPGIPSPTIKQVCWHEKDGFVESGLNITSHVGTHLDAPYHIIENARSLSELDVDTFIGKAFKIECSVVDVNVINRIKEKVERLGNPDFILIQTNWDKFWGEDKYYQNIPLPDKASFEFLSRLQLKGIAIDAISIDQVDADDLVNHKLILGNGSVIVENLKDLKQLPDTMFEFFCFPLKIENGDGSPVRAVAKI